MTERRVTLAVVAAVFVTAAAVLPAAVPAGGGIPPVASTSMGELGSETEVIEYAR